MIALTKIRNTGMLFVLIIIAMASVGCVGKDFVRPNSEQLQLGMTNYKELIKSMGNPNYIREAMVNSKKIIKLGYGYTTMSGKPAAGAVPFRDQELFFYNDTLVGHRFVSSFDADNTDFDERKVQNIEKGTTTRPEVIDMLGEPTTVYISPLTPEDVVEILGYAYGVVYSSSHQTWKELQIEIDKDGTVSDFSYSTQNTRRP